MNAIEFRNMLMTMGACTEALKWSNDKSLKTVWNTCERGDWLLWLAARMIGKEGWPTHQEVVLAACDCAETALKYVKVGEYRPKRCTEVVRAWARGEASIKQVREARRAAQAAAYDAYAAAAYAGYDAYAAGAYAAAAAAHAGYDAAYTAAAAAAAAAHAAGYDAARSQCLKYSADLVRARLKVSA